MSDDERGHMGKPLTGVQRPPAGLSRWARAVWKELHEDLEFTKAELVVFERALRLFDRADGFWDQAEREGVLKGDRTHPLLASHRDLAMLALRYWRSLGFKDDPAERRRPGRPSGDEWNDKRKAGAAAQRIAQERARRHA